MSSEIRSMLHAVAGFAIRNGDTAPSETLPEATERAFLIRLIAYRSLEFLKSRVLSTHGYRIRVSRGVGRLVCPC